MHESGYQANRFKKNGSVTIERVITFTITNDGETDLHVTISGVSRKIIPNSQFLMDADFTHTTYEIYFEFETGIGSAILDYKILKC